MKPRRLLLLLLTPGLVLGWSAASAEDFAESIDGRSYEGWLEARAEPVGGESIVRYGSAVIQIVPQGNGRATLRVTGTIDGDDQSASFWSEGRIVGGGWESDGDAALHISSEGRISGTATVGPRQMTFSGSATPNQIELVVDLTLLEAAGPAMAAGSRFRFTYDVSRASPSAPEAAEDEQSSTAESGECSEIRYEMRPTPSFNGGPMGMIRVPVCIGD